jgi:hypothetical protein
MDLTRIGLAQARCQSPPAWKRGGSIRPFSSPFQRNRRDQPGVDLEVRVNQIALRTHHSNRCRLRRRSRQQTRFSSTHGFSNEAQHGGCDFSGDGSHPLLSCACLVPLRLEK